MITVTFNSFEEMEKAASDFIFRLNSADIVHKLSREQTEKAPEEVKPAEEKPKKKAKAAEINEDLENAMPAPEKQPAAEEAKPDVLEHKIQEVRQALYELRKKSGAAGPALITQILAEFNATALGQIPHSRYGEVLDRVAQLMKEES